MAEDFCYGMPHKGICPLLKQWRKVAKGKATEESAGLRQEMVEHLRAAVSAMPGGRTMATLSAGGKTHALPCVHRKRPSEPMTSL